MYLEENIKFEKYFKNAYKIKELGRILKYAPEVLLEKFKARKENSNLMQKFKTKSSNIVNSNSFVLNSLLYRMLHLE